jgi:spoIIIJ-associated protein
MAEAAGKVPGEWRVKGGRKRGKRMQQFEQSGKTPEDALQAAEERIGRKLRKSEYRIVDAGTRGVLGLIGGKPAVIEVTIREGETDTRAVDTEDQEVVSEWTIQETEELLDRMGLPGRAAIDIAEGYYKVDIDVDDSDGGILIGRRGSTLEAFQHILRRVVERRAGKAVPIVVDVGGYRDRKRMALIERAERLADKVKRSGRQFTLDPMAPGERRAVHLALKENRDVMTYSIGDEPERKIVIAPAKGGRGGKPERRNGRQRERPRRERREQSSALVDESLAEEVTTDEATSQGEAAYGRKRLYRRPRNRPTRPPASEE